jgi:hypothetical protein
MCLDWMVASITQIQSPLNFLIIEFWFIAVIPTDFAGYRLQQILYWYVYNFSYAEVAFPVP